MNNTFEHKINQSFLNGKVTSEVSAFSRALYYGHGLFETVRIASSQAPLWDFHIKRLISGAKRLGLKVEDNKLLEHYRNQCLSQSPPNCVLKILVMAGKGGRGYVTPDELSIDYLFQSFELPEGNSSSAKNGIKLWVSQQRLSHAPSLAGIKHLNRLEQVLARAEQSVDLFPEGVMLDQQGNVVEAISSNIFCLRNNKWLTPRLDQCGVAGVMREYLIVNHKVETTVIPLSDLSSMDEIFVCNSIKGIQPVTCIEGVADWEVGPKTRQWQELLAKEIPCFEP